MVICCNKFCSLFHMEEEEITTSSVYPCKRLKSEEDDKDLNSISSITSEDDMSIMNEKSVSSSDASTKESAPQV